MPAFAWDKNQQIAASGFQRMTAYEKLMKAGLEFRRSDLRVNLPAGNIKGDVTLRLLKDMTFMQFAPPYCATRADPRYILLQIKFQPAG
jgi:hypothetical protein